ncbi:long-chain fatty acid--CoA ligase [Nocardia sp. NPDC050712]|uniref:long-chain fatty acid--CoA ligase n=1 Tax=Nocardia sp. NPDC050712 TaxID=3155518 RepID=UPI0033FB69D8
MQDRPLSLPLLMDGLRGRFSHKTVSTQHNGFHTTASYGEIAQRIARLAAALDHLEIPRGARVGSFGWNSQRHLELYMAVPCSNRILHTINHRLFAEDIVYIVNDAADEVLFVDRSILEVVWPLIDRFETVRHVVVMDDGVGMAIPQDFRVHDYEELIAAAVPVDGFEVADERDAAALCYTSGTTGRPKGVLYDHRSIVLHAMTLLMSDTFAISESDVVMPIVPMFHVNAWGLPYAAMMAGASLALPGAATAPAQLAYTIATARVSFAAAVTTIWRSVLPLLQNRELPALRRLVSGGSALPVDLSRRYHEQVGVPLTSSWGMTETSPLVCSARVGSDQTGLDIDDQIQILARPGPPVPLTALRLQHEDGTFARHDGVDSGELQVSGPTVAGGYYGSTDGSAAFTEDGWLRTGDVATIDVRGHLRIVDRTKDLIKSGGEWISSVELENAIMSSPEVSEAAVIATAHDTWGERPLACVVPVEGSAVTPESIRSHLTGLIARWWIPEQIVILSQIPKTATGKVAKLVLRQHFNDPAVAPALAEIGHP